MSAGLDVMIEKAREEKKAKAKRRPKKKKLGKKTQAPAAHQTYREQVKSYILKTPIKALLIAAAAGLAVGLFATPRRK